MMQGTATTNSDGVFRIAGLPPGSYLLYTQPARDGDGLHLGASARSTDIRPRTIRASRIYPRLDC